MEAAKVAPNRGKLHQRPFPPVLRLGYGPIRESRTHHARGHADHCKMRLCFAMCTSCRPQSRGGAMALWATQCAQRGAQPQFGSFSCSFQTSASDGPWPTKQCPRFRVPFRAASARLPRKFAKQLLGIRFARQNRQALGVWKSVAFVLVLIATWAHQSSKMILQHDVFSLGPEP